MLTPSKLVKIITYCPKKSAEAVRLAIGQAGGGKIGNYSNCAFLSAGEGYFLPLDGAHPALGKIGKIEKVKEIKIEFVCEEEKIKDVIAAIKSVHPYEEVVIEILPLLNYEQ